MTIILFLIDTSASMNERTYLGARPTLLDVAKDAVEKFLKIRQRDQASRGDRYMLLTFEENPANIKAGWKEHHNVFMTELKNLTANGMTTLGPALKNCFDLLNLNRMQTGIDTYGQGRCPYFLEPSIIIVITDGGKLTTTSAVQEELNLPMHSYVPGSELTKEPFRWDQRLFALVLRLTGTPPPESNSNGAMQVVPVDSSPIEAMCEVTGGRSFLVNSQRTLNQCLESIVQKIQGGVVIHFEKVGPDPPVPADTETVVSASEHNEESNGESSNDMKLGYNQVKNWQSCRKLIYVQRSALKGYSVGHWPIPEAFWPDLSAPSLPPRTCHPIVKFSCASTEPMIIENLPFDKYEIESCALTNYIISRKQPHVAWQCYISNSSSSGLYNGKTDLGFPFGYLKASTSLTCVNLYVLPYNYPVLLPLLDELFRVFYGKPPRDWKMNFDNYLKNMPLYYATPLKRALQRMSAPNLVPEAMENCLSYSVLNYLKRLKNQAKVEFEKLIVTVGKPGLHSQIESIKLYQNPFSRRLHDLVVTFEDNHFAEPMQHNSKKNTEVMMVDDRCSSNEIIYLKTQKSLQAIRNEINEFPGFALRIKDKCKDPKPQCYKNPFDINRSNLIDQISRMRINFLQKNVHQIKMHTDEQLHSLPISQMGNYQDYLKKMQPSLRELEQQPVRQHMFGNPFKFDKKVQMMVDEADIDLVGNNGLGNKGKRNVGDINPNRAKRRPGPLPKDFTLQRPLSNLGSIGSPVINGSASPVYSPPPSPIVSNNENLLSSDEGEETNVFPVNLKLLPTSTSIVTPSINSVNSATGNINHSVSTSINCNVTGVVGTMNHNHSNTNHNHCLPVNDLSGSISDIENDCDAVQNKLQDNSIAPVNGLATSNGLFDLSPNDLQTRKTLFKLVRKPGRNYEQLTSLLAKSFGSARTYLLEQVIFEAGRFKRKALVEHLMAAFPTESVHFNNGV